MRSVRIAESPGVVFAMGGTSSLELRDSTIDGGAAGVVLEDQSRAALHRATVTNIGTGDSGVGITLGEGDSALEQLTLTLDENSTVPKCGTGILANDSATLTVRNSQFIENRRSAVHLRRGTMNAMFNNVTFSANETMVDTNETASALDIGTLAAPVNLVVRNSRILNNGFDGASYTGAAVILRGDAASVFDLGTKASPGNNRFENNRQPGSLKVWVNPGVTVSASGNVWNASVQGAEDADGRYAAGVGPCASPGACDVTSGTGTNYEVTTGTLRLVEP